MNLREKTTTRYEPRSLLLVNPKIKDMGSSQGPILCYSNPGTGSPHTDLHKEPSCYTDQNTSIRHEDPNKGRTLPTRPPLTCRLKSGGHTRPTKQKKQAIVHVFGHRNIYSHIMPTRRQNCTRQASINLAQIVGAVLPTGLANRPGGARGPDLDLPLSPEVGLALRMGRT